MNNILLKQNSLMKKHQKKQALTEIKQDYSKSIKSEKYVGIYAGIHETELIKLNAEAIIKDNYKEQELKGLSHKEILENKKLLDKEMFGTSMFLYKEQNNSDILAYEKRQVDNVFEKLYGGLQE